MTSHQPLTSLDARYSGENARAVPWKEALDRVEQAGLFWVATVRRDGRPHVTPVVGAWADGAFYFTTGADEQKSKNLAANPHCAVITGCNTWDAGLDIILHGNAVVVRDLPLLRTVADAFLAKYGSDWAFEVVEEDGTFRLHGVALVYQVAPAQALGFGKGEPFSHTRWDFGEPMP
jgi:hypothetical protein